MKTIEDEAFGLVMYKLRECASRARVLVADVYGPGKQDRDVLVHTRAAEIFDRIANAEEAAR